MRKESSRIPCRHADYARRHANHAHLFQTRLARDRGRGKIHLRRSRKRLCRLRRPAQGRRGAHHPLALRPPGRGGRRSDPDPADRDTLRPHVGRGVRDELLHDAPGQQPRELPMSGADGRADIRQNGVGISDSWHFVSLFLSVFRTARFCPLAILQAPSDRALRRPFSPSGPSRHRECRARRSDACRQKQTRPCRACPPCSWRSG